VSGLETVAHEHDVMASSFVWRSSWDESVSH